MRSGGSALVTAASSGGWLNVAMRVVVLQQQYGSMVSGLCRGLLASSSAKEEDLEGMIAWEVTVCTLGLLWWSLQSSNPLVSSC